MNSISRHTVANQARILILVSLAVTACPMRAQVPPSGVPFTQGSGDLGSVLRESAQKVLDSCKSWPPKLARKASDQNKKLDDKALVMGNDIITTQLASNLNINRALKPYLYEASYLRLLDSVGTFNPGIPNTQLLGIALYVDPEWSKNWNALKRRDVRFSQSPAAVSLSQVSPR